MYIDVFWNKLSMISVNQATLSEHYLGRAGLQYQWYPYLNVTFRYDSDFMTGFVWTWLLLLHHCCYPYYVNRISQYIAESKLRCKDYHLNFSAVNFKSIFCIVCNPIEPKNDNVLMLDLVHNIMDTPFLKFADMFVKACFVINSLIMA